MPNTDQPFIPDAAAFTSLESESELTVLRAQLQESNREKIAAQRQLALKERQEKARIIQAQSLAQSQAQSLAQSQAQSKVSSVQQVTDKTKRAQIRARQQQAELKRLRELKILREEQERQREGRNVNRYNRYNCKRKNWKKQNRSGKGCKKQKK